MATIDLYNFIRISNSIDDDFAEIMGQTHVGNTEADTDTNEMKAPDIADGDLMANIREQIANALWANKNIL